MIMIIIMYLLFAITMNSIAHKTNLLHKSYVEFGSHYRVSDSGLLKIKYKTDST